MTLSHVAATAIKLRTKKYYAPFMLRSSIHARLDAAGALSYPLPQSL